MYEQIAKPKESKNKTVSNAVGQKKSCVKQSSGFVDNRFEVVALQKLANANSISNITVAKREKPKENKNSASIDANVQKKAIIPAKGKSSNIIQKYSYNADGAEITAHFPKNDTRKWIESVDAEVSWNKGEIMDPNSQGSSTVNNHGWKGVLKNQSNGNNATGLHMVNAKWGIRKCAGWKSGPRDSQLKRPS